MSTMMAYQLVEWGKPGEFREVVIPDPGPGQVLLKVVGSGLCRTDLNILNSTAGYWPEPPYTIGHEVAGTVEKLGPDVTSVAEGDGVMVSGIYFCGHCDKCVKGRHNECRNLTLVGYGIAVNGGLAPYMLAEARHLVPLGDLDPKEAAPLADAGSTSYTAVKKALPLLVPGSTAVVIGVGGLGAYAVQYLRELSPATIIGLDTQQSRLDTAARLGAAHTYLSDEHASKHIREVTNGNGAEVVLDFVGRTATMKVGVESLSSGGQLSVTGIGGGNVGFGWEIVPDNCSFVQNRGFTLGDMRESVALASTGRIEMAYTEFPFTEVQKGLDALASATVEGRALVTFDE